MNPQLILKQAEASEELLATFGKPIARGARVICGIGSSSSLDRNARRVWSHGMQPPEMPLPLLDSHDWSRRIGEAHFVKQFWNFVYFEAALAYGSDPAEQAWRAIEARSVRGVSIGFRQELTVEGPVGSGYVNVTKWELREISIVAEPANPMACLARHRPSLRLCDQPVRRALG